MFTLSYLNTRHLRKTRDAIEGLHNFPEFSYPASRTFLSSKSFSMLHVVHVSGISRCRLDGRILPIPECLDEAM